MKLILIYYSHGYATKQFREISLRSKMIYGREKKISEFSFFAQICPGLPAKALQSQFSALQCAWTVRTCVSSSEPSFSSHTLTLSRKSVVLCKSLTQTIPIPTWLWGIEDCPLGAGRVLLCSGGCAEPLAAAVSNLCPSGDISGVKCSFFSHSKSTTPIFY